MHSHVHRFKLKDEHRHKLSLNTYTHTSTVRYSATLSIQNRTPDACTHIVGCSIFIGLTAEGFERTRQLRQTPDKVNSSHSPSTWHMEKNEAKWETTDTQNTIIASKVTSLNVMIDLSRFGTFQPFCLTDKQRSINRSPTAAWYLKTRLLSMLGYLTKSHCEVSGKNIPIKSLENSVSLTVPLDGCKPNSQRITVKTNQQ